MEGKLTKRRRIYSVEPSKIAQAEFARIYLSHLVPALMKLNQKKSTVHSSEDDEKKNSCMNVVKHEVGMAMVCSAPPGFAWSKALKAKFQTDHTDVGKINDEDGDHHHNNAPSSPYNFSANPTTGSSKSCLHNEEEGLFERLRRLIPGGEEMGEDEEEMARELESYISCLQMQVNILQCLAETTP
ncbi:hypothetical protein K1719_039301 [Acacia pycnantha]|nr:hypothetical protein K1719_039301 [Acacia pycnantha]